jgi:arylsulfatase A-like enzyme
VVLDKLHDLKLEGETAIVLVSDHGFFLGDHGLTGKISTRLHPELIHVPLIVIHPGRRLAGQTRRWLASTHDVAPTLLSMAGVPVPRSMDGGELSRFFEGKRPENRPYAWGGYGNSFFIRSERWKAFGGNRGGDLHLYAPRADHHEWRNLAGSRPAKARELFGAVRRRAGGALPYYPGTI